MVYSLVYSFLFVDVRMTVFYTLSLCVCFFFSGRGVFKQWLVGLENSIVPSSLLCCFTSVDYAI
jgi:hypothetical protein